MVMVYYWCLEDDKDLLLCSAEISIYNVKITVIGFARSEGLQLNSFL